MVCNPLEIFKISRFIGFFLNLASLPFIVDTQKCTVFYYVLNLAPDRTIEKLLTIVVLLDSARLLDASYARAVALESCIHRMRNPLV